MPSAQVSDFEDNGLLIRHVRLSCNFCSFDLIEGGKTAMDNEMRINQAITAQRQHIQGEKTILFQK
jgi:hypothetical protein